MRVLVTGGSGGLGRYVVRALSARGLDVLAPGRDALDITRQEDLRAYVAYERPEAVVHLAALANVDRCSEDPVLATRTNATATRHLVETCGGRLVRPFVYMSTNDLFSECAGGPFSESCDPAPGMAYSWSKYAGELAVLTVGGLAVRANFFTRHCRAKLSFAAYVIQNAGAGIPFRCYTNVRAAPVFAGTLAERMVDALLSGRAGVLHVASTDSVSRDEQARLLCRAYGLPEDGIMPVPLLDRRGRPLDARLTSERGGLVGTVAEEVAKLVREEPL